MKTTTNRKKTFAGKHEVLLAIFLLFSAEYMMSQRGVALKENNENLGVMTSMIVSAEGYGSRCSPALYYKNKRRTLSAGPVIQNSKSSVTGVQLNYFYTIAGKDAIGNECYNENLELFGFISASYYYNAALGKRALREEKLANTDYEGDPCQLRFKSLSLYAGVGLKLTIFKNFKWINSMGLGGYKSFQFPPHLYYNECNLGLTIRTGISYDFKK
ncbi:MAG: hypothetical protein ACXVNR_01655 [Bacteroidia bacterium]